jgi:hypothetical protein
MIGDSRIHQSLRKGSLTKASWDICIIRLSAILPSVKNQILRLPVLDHDNRIVGIVSLAIWRSKTTKSVPA